MANWNICEDPYPGPDELPSFGEIMSQFKQKYLTRGRQTSRLAGYEYEYEYYDEYIEYEYKSPPTIPWSSAGADPIKDLRDAMSKAGKPTVVMGERMKELVEAFKDIPVTPLTIDMPKYETADGKKKSRTRGPRTDFGFDRRGRKIR